MVYCLLLEYSMIADDLLGNLLSKSKLRILPPMHASSVPAHGDIAVPCSVRSRSQYLTYSLRNSFRMVSLLPVWTNADPSLMVKQFNAERYLKGHKLVNLVTGVVKVLLQGQPTLHPTEPGWSHMRLQQQRDRRDTLYWSVSVDLNRNAGCAGDPSA